VAAGVETFARRRADDLAAARWAVPALLAAAAAYSLWLRTGVIGGGFWIDEGISVGIAHHHWTSIPHVLRQDGSPPLYYLLLGLWIRVFGDSEAATHALSLVFATACIPLAYAAGRSLFDRRVAVVAALIASLDPFLTYYAQETRMYALAAMLSLVATLAFVNGVLRGRRAWAAVLVLALAAMVYAHNWGLFFCVAVAVTTFAVARERWRLLVAVAAGTVLLYLPWMPTLVSQVVHTGAPWAKRPTITALLWGAGEVIGGVTPLALLALTAATVRWRGVQQVERALVWLAGATVAGAWLSSQVSPAWTTRYFSVILGPMVLLAAVVLVRAGRLGLVAGALLFVLVLGYHPKNDKENANLLAASLGRLHPAELVVSTHPEQVPVLRYYLGPGLRWRTTLGPAPDARVFDWRDAVSRLRAQRMRDQVAQTVAAVRPGQEFVVVAPVFRDYHAWNATWTKLVWRTSTAYTAALQADPDVALVRHVTTNELVVHHNYFKLLQAYVYRRLR